MSIRGSDSGALESSQDASTIPFWRCRAPMLFLASGDDWCYSSPEHASQAAALMETHGKRNYQVGRSTLLLLLLLLMMLLFLS